MSKSRLPVEEDKYETIKGKDGVEYTTLKSGYSQYISEKKYQYKLEKSGIDHYYWGIEFSDYQGSLSLPEVNKIKKYANSCHLSEMDYVHLYLWGEHSCQKSSLAYCVGKTALRNGLNVKRVLSGDLINLLMKLQGFSFNQDFYSQLKEIERQDLLIIDDVFDDKKALMWQSDNKDMIISEWDCFLRKLLSSKTKVVMTSNFPVESIKQKYGQSLYELVDRNMIKIQLLDSVKEKRKSYVEGKLDD